MFGGVCGSLSSWLPWKSWGCQLHLQCIKGSVKSVQVDQVVCREVNRLHMCAQGNVYRSCVEGSIYRQGDV